MSETINPDTASSETVVEHPGLPRSKWHKIVLGMPLLVIVLCILVGIAAPGDAFFEGNAPGIYWLHLHFFEIVQVLFMALFIACTLGLLCAGLRAVLGLPLDLLDSTMTVINVVSLGLLIILTFTSIHFGSLPHLGSKKTEYHVYHLVGTVPVSHYLVIECDRFGFICQQIYKSDQMGALYQWNGLLEYDPATDAIRLIDSGNVLFTHQATP